MNLKTITYDADQWQLVPKRLSNAMRLVYDAELSIGMNYDAMLREAEQPETLSPWMPIDEFLKTDGTVHCWIKYKGETKIALFDAVMKKFLYVGGGTNCFLTECVSHAMPLPQSPEVK